MIVASFSLGSLDISDEDGLLIRSLKIAEGGAADASLIGDFPGPTGNDI